LRQTFAAEISNWIRNDSEAVLLLGDIGVGAFSKTMVDYPDRIINIGILEQSMISFASGLVLSGKKVIVHSIAPFLIDRAYEQIKIDFGYRDLPCLLVSVGASFDYGKLGSTHHAPEDVALFSTIPKSRIFVPGSKKEVMESIRIHRENPSLDYLRISSVEHTLDIDAKNGFEILINKKDRPTIVVIGSLLEQALPVAKELNLSLIYLNRLEIDVDKKFPKNDHPYFIVEPFFEGTTNFYFKNINNKKSKVYSFGIKKYFYRTYIEYSERLFETSLDSASLLKDIKSKLLLSGYNK
jgi:transketolase